MNLSGLQQQARANTFLYDSVFATFVQKITLHISMHSYGCIHNISMHNGDVLVLMMPYTETYYMMISKLSQKEKDESRTR